MSQVVTNLKLPATTKLDDPDLASVRQPASTVMWPRAYESMGRETHSTAKLQRVARIVLGIHRMAFRVTYGSGAIRWGRAAAQIDAD